MEKTITGGLFSGYRMFFSARTADRPPFRTIKKGLFHTNTAKQQDIVECMPDDGPGKVGRHMRGPGPTWETLLFILSAAAFSLLMVGIDFADRFYAFTRAHEEWELDEIVVSFGLVLTVHLAAYSIRRWIQFRKMYIEAHTDPLTGLFNRRRLVEVLTLEVERARRFDRPLAAAMMDIDHFKRINDTMGHQYGDRVLKDVAGLIRCNVRMNDSVSRWGGEEFFILMVESDLESARRIVERIRMEVEAHFSSDELPVTISGGVKLLSAGDTEESLVEGADALLYKAKENGRNRIEHEIKSPA